MVSFFSHAITPLQRHFGIGSRELLRRLGEEFGSRVAEQYAEADVEMMLSELSVLWKKLEIGTLEIESRKPLTLLIRDCSICGQIPEIGKLFKCTFHEGFIEGLLRRKLGREVHVEQRGEYAGTAGMWTRRYITDVTL